MNLKEIQERMDAIKAELELEEADIDALDAEFRSLKEEKQSIEERNEKRANLLNDIANGAGTVIKTFKEEKEEKSMEDFNKEYRSAFLKTIMGVELSAVEQRAYTHTTENTGAVVPEELQNKIYSAMEENHPILADVQVLRTGAVISIAKHTAIVAGDAAIVAEGVANDDEENTFVNVSLSGKDFSKHIEFSYALGLMSVPAFETYLVNEISNRLGAAMAADIIAQIKSDMNAANAVNVATAGTLALSDVTKLYGLLKTSGQVFAYANNATVWTNVANIAGAEGQKAFIPNAQDAISGQLLGVPLKKEDAMGANEILVVAPKEFVYNIVQDIMIERDKDIKRHVHVISGYARAEGVLTNDLAAALLTVGTGA